MDGRLIIVHDDGAEQSVRSKQSVRRRWKCVEMLGSDWDRLEGWLIMGLLPRAKEKEGLLSRF
jgi:hypothetical protein